MKLKKAYKHYIKLNTYLLSLSHPDADKYPISFEEFRGYFFTKSMPLIPLADFYPIYNDMYKFGANDGVMAQIFKGRTGVPKLVRHEENLDGVVYEHKDEEPTEATKTYVETIEKLSKEWKEIEEQKTERIVLQLVETERK